MKKKLFLSTLAALGIGVLICGSLPTPARASGLSSYEPKALTSIDVEPMEIETPSLSSSAPSAGLSSIDVEPVEINTPSLSSSAPSAGLSGIDVEPVEIETPSLSSSAPSAGLSGIDVEPVEIETPSLSNYDVPDIKGLAPVEIQPFYVSLVGYLDDAQLQQLSTLSGDIVAELVQKQYDLIVDLNAAFAEAGILVNIDPVSGTIPIDASLLYATNEYQVTEAGKQTLRELLGVYCSVLSQEKYRDFISRIKVIGHTDSDGSYDYNVKLSQNRAEAVRDFCLSEECGVEDLDWLAARLVAEGHSYDELIYDASGREDKAASRRVEISFEINLEG